jgi:hypothetical protein
LEILTSCVVSNAPVLYRVTFMDPKRAKRNEPRASETQQLEGSVFRARNGSIASVFAAGDVVRRGSIKPATAAGMGGEGGNALLDIEEQTERQDAVERRNSWSS